VSPKNYKLTIDGQTYDVEVGNTSTSPVDVTVDGVDYQVELPESASAASSASPAPAPAAAPKSVTPPAPSVSRPAVPTSGGDGVIRAPMPGRIVSVNVSVGDSVTSGQAVVILESMKMENTISATSAGSVTAVHVAAGDSVQHGQTLVEIS